MKILSKGKAFVREYCKQEQSGVFSVQLNDDYIQSILRCTLSQNLMFTVVVFITVDNKRNFLDTRCVSCDLAETD